MRGLIIVRGPGAMQGVYSIIIVINHEVGIHAHVCLLLIYSKMYMYMYMHGIDSRASTVGCLLLIKPQSLQSCLVRGYTLIFCLLVVIVCMYVCM